jgi:hypothetical protein
MELIRMTKALSLMLGVVWGLAFVVAAQSSEGLVSHWGFAESEGAVALDLVSLNHGTLSGTTWVTGVVGSSVGFDGQESYVDCGSADQLMSVSETTLAGWVKFSCDGVPRAIISIGNGVGAMTNDYALLINHTNTGTVRVLACNGSEVQAIRGRTSIGDNAWHHVAFVMSSDSFALYIDGEIDVEPVARTVTPQWAEGFRLYLGDLRPLSSTTWKLVGAIDEVRIYSRALSAQEVVELYVEGSRGFSTSSALLMGGIACTIGVLVWARKAWPGVAVESLLVGISLVVLAGAIAVGLWTGHGWLKNWLVWSGYLVLSLAFVLGGVRQARANR